MHLRSLAMLVLTATPVAAQFSTPGMDPLAELVASEAVRSPNGGIKAIARVGAGKDSPTIELLPIGAPTSAAHLAAPVKSLLLLPLPAPGLRPKLVAKPRKRGHPRPAIKQLRSVKNQGF